MQSMGLIDSEPLIIPVPHFLPRRLTQLAGGPSFAKQFDIRGKNCTRVRSRAAAVIFLKRGKIERTSRGSHARLCVSKKRSAAGFRPHLQRGPATRPPVGFPSKEFPYPSLHPSSSRPGAREAELWGQVTRKGEKGMFRSFFHRLTVLALAAFFFYRVRYSVSLWRLWGMCTRRCVSGPTSQQRRSAAV